MGKLSKRMKRLLAVLLVEVIVASNVFVSYADEQDEPYQVAEADLVEEFGSVEENIATFSDYVEPADENYDDWSDSDDESSDEEIFDEDQEEEPEVVVEEEVNSEDGSEDDEPDADESEPVGCTCDVKCSTDGYDEDCPVCSEVVDAGDAESFLDDNCKGKENQTTDDKKDEVKAEIVKVDNSVTVTAICVIDGEEIDGTESFEIKVDDTVDVLEKAPEIEGYTFAEKATIKDGGEISKIMKETVEEKEETEVDGEMVVTKITTTTSMSYYDGTQWKELENDIVVVFEYTQDEETDEEETAAVKFIASFVDQDGNAIEGYANKTLTFGDTLDLTEEPFAIENYTYVEAQINDVVVTSINKKTETDEEGEEVVTYSYTADGEDVEVTEDTEVTLVYEGGEEVVEAEITLVCVDEEGLTIDGYAKTELPEFDKELVLDDPEKAPVEIEGYEYKEALIDGTVVTALVKEAAEESDDAEEAVSTYSYVTEDGETVAIEEDTEITLSYEEAEVAVELDATIVDEFGDEIDEKYTNMDISKIFDKDDELTLDDPEAPPVKKVSVRKSLFKTIKYTYVKASVDNEIITGLKRKAIESEDAKASDAEYAYSYTTDGETWTKIKEDTTVIFEYSDGKKTTYTYEDSFVSVTATLQHANAIPDDAEFIVTPVTPSTSGYNYDAYMEALNKNASQIGDSKDSSDKDAKKYTEDNTLLYDIAFLAEPVDEDGNAVEGSKVEYQPAEGMVKISITFKQKQLEEDLSAEKAADVTVIHMPLADAVKESVDTTADATGISASDINVEVVDAAISVSAEQVDFSLSDFSVVAVNAEGNKVFEPGREVTYKSVLGSAVNYGIVAREVANAAHMDTNFATILLNNAAQTTGGKYTGSHNPGDFIIAEYNGSGWFTDCSDATRPFVIYTTEDAKAKFNDSLFTNNGMMIVDTSFAQAELVEQVNTLLSGIDSSLASEEGYTAEEIFEERNQKQWIDLTNSPAGTYYVNFSEGEYGGKYADQADRMFINMNADQNIVLNIPDATVNLSKFQISIDGGNTWAGSDKNDASADVYAQRVVFNMPNATEVNAVSSIMGVVLCPNADFFIGSTSTGWLVANKVTNGGEWHGVWQEMPDSVHKPASNGFKASKTVNGEVPTTDQMFKFNLEELKDGEWEYVETKINDGSSIKFSDISYEAEGTYYYRVSEVKADDEYQYDETKYIVEVVVDSDVSQIGNLTKTTYKIKSVTYYTGETAEDAVDANKADEMTFNNEKIEKGSIAISKVVAGKTTDESFYFTLTGSDGPVVNADGSVAVYEVKAGGSVLVDGLVYGTYTLTETNAEGTPVSFESGFPYKITYSSQNITVESKEVQTATITNTYETTSVSGIKTWNDDENKDGKRPESITIRLWADGVEVKSETVTAGTSWTWNFTNLPKYANGKEIKYTVTEDPVENYTTNVDGYDVINTHESEKTEVSGSKTWNDNDNQDGKRPSSITINLFANGKLKESKTVTEADGWSWTFDNLDKYANGTEINYTITEEEVEDYTTAVDGYDVINTHAPGKTSVNGSKTWDDSDNQDGKRPESITINLYANGVLKESKTVTEADGWSWTFDNLDKYANGKEIEYTITEDVVSDYTTAVNGYNVINTHNPEKTFVSGSKTWNDNDNQDGIRPSSITINLYANGELKESKTVTESENWSWSFTGLDKYADGEVIEYTITEDVVEDYTAEVKGYNVENTHTPEKTEVSGTKTWNDNDNQDGKRPASITINLLANGKKVDSKTVTEADGWSWTFDNLDKYADGQEINYTITEEKVEDYTTEVDGYDVVNTHAPGKTSVNGSKTWNDNGNQDGKRPASITIRLYANGEEIGSKVVTETDNWSWNFENLDKYANGKEIKYTVTEDAVTDYTTVVNGYNVINTHNPEKTFVNGSKTWTDAENQDGIRPTSITINLYANGVLKDSKTVTEGENWSWSFTELDKYAGGKEIEYTITEDVVKGYETEVKGYNVENTHTPEQTEVSGTKTWNDNDNQDGKRPTSITINLLANGKKVDSKTVTEADGWSWTFDNLDKYANGQEINYTITEEEVDDYTTEVNGYDVVNTHAPGKTSVNGSKTWNDNNNQDGKRPASITIRLWADGKEVQSKVVTEANNWSWNFDELDKYANGKEIKYTVTEDAVTDYTTVVNGYNVINTHNPEKTFVNGSKTWTDADNQDGIRPTSITINLYANGVLKDSKTVTEGENWSWSFTELDKYADGKEIEYTITEDVVKGYVSDINGYNVENTHTPEKTEVSGSKTWNDNDNQDGKRPASITINLLANGKKVDSKTVTEADGWSWTFDNLDKYANGQEINYTITEEEVEDYTTEVNGYDVKNTHAPGKTSVNGSKTWNDNNNQDGKRPASITIRLWADGKEVQSKVVTEANNWSWNFDELDKYANGKEIKYTVTEDAVTDYTTVVNGYNVINTHNPEKTFVNGSKTWTDADNQDGIRPTSITINLYANGVLKDSKTVTEGNNWSWSFTELDKYAGGEEIEYTITEDVVKGYTADINGYNVENTHTPEKTEVSGSKTWNDNDNQDGKRPTSITINLLANGKPAGSKTVTEADGWSWTFDNLDKYADGQEINYTITEEKVEDYTTEINGYDVKNTHAPGKTSVNGSKTWNDNNNQDGKRPASITIRLYANGEEIDSKTVTEADGWSWTFDDLDEYANGEEIVYTISEDEVAEYTTEVNGHSVINTHNPEKTFVSGSKTWTDAENQDGIRPTSITINLYANGVLKDSKTVTEGNNWSWSFTELDKYADGEEIEYTITEDVVKGYTTEIKGYNVENTHTPEKTEVSGSKTWNDNNNQDGKRPVSITINLLANGKEVDSKTVTEADGWSWTFDNLDKYANGQEINYTITEEEVDDYTTEVSGYDVINTHAPGKTSVNGSKTWNDNGNQDGKRPTSIVIRLYADGEEIDSKTVTEEDGWSWTFDELDKYANGTEIKYTVAEEKVEDYTTEVNGYSVINTHNPEKTFVSGSKTWNDENNQDGKRPASITINLYANGALKDSKVVTEKDNWTFKFENLDKYADGEEIEYTITEEAVEYYETQINGTRVFNTHTPEKTTVEGSKTWKADENGEEAIPESIIIRLYANGTEVDSKTVTEADGWKWSFTNLDKFKDGKEITYTITEDRVLDYSTEVKGYDVINTYTPDYTQISVTKVWDDNDDQDGIRPDSIMVQLYDGLFKKGEAVELNEGNNWSYTWSNLPDSRFGLKINYSVKEVGTVDGYDAEVIDGTTTTITNVHVPETVEVNGEKTWNDNENQDGIRPTSITINLLADGEVIDSVEVTEADEWKWSFTELPKNKNVNGVVSEIIYTITEEVVDGYETEITGFDVANTHTPEVIEIEGTKTWDDADNQDGIRPTSITVHLFANGTEVESKTVSEADGWSWKFENLDKFKDGVEIEYTLTEDVVTGYSTTVDGFDITNSYTPGVTSRTVNKVWDDAGNRDNLRPVSIRVQLYADGEAYGEEVILSEANGWSYTWSDLAEKKGGESITYTVAETVIVDGYTVSYSDNTFVITNTHTPTPTPTPGSTPTPGNEPTPTPGDEPTPTPEVNPTPGTPGATPTPNDEEVLGARRSKNAVLGARRGPKTAVLGKRRRPSTGDSLALLIWIMVLSLGAGGAVTSSTMLKMKKRDEK